MLRLRLVALLLLLGPGLVGPSALARTTERDLALCPRLRPLRPPPVDDPEVLRCRAAVARGVRDYADALLLTHQDCIARVQRREIGGHPMLVCRGAPYLSWDTRGRPADGATFVELLLSSQAFALGIRAECSDAAVAALDLCADDEAGLEDCLGRATRRHVHFLLDAQYGLQNSVDAFTPIDAPEVRTCQDALARAGRAYVGEVQAAISDCLQEEPRHGRARFGGRAESAQRCIGQVWRGWRVRPYQRETARRLRRAEAELRETLAASCGDAELAALDACGADAESLAECLLCTHHREALYLIGDQFGGRPARRSRPFIDWESLRNPVLELDDRMLKDQTAAFQRGWFYLYTSNRLDVDDPERATKPHWFYRTRDFRHWERRVDGNANLNGPGRGPGSPDLVKLGDTWIMTFQNRLPEDASRSGLYSSTSRNLLDWTPKRPHASGDFLGPNVIDGALARHEGFYYLAFKDRDDQTFYVTRSATPALDQRWLPRRRAYAGGESVASYFAENFQLIRIDGTWRLIATARDPEPRCGRYEYGLFLNLYICSNEPYIYTLDGDGSELEHWTSWIQRRQLVIPYEDWNVGMHANSAFLVDWRRYDGFFYLFYAGSLDGYAFELRGHGKIGMARSRDLVHWRLPGDLRD